MGIWNFRGAASKADVHSSGRHSRFAFLFDFRALSIPIAGLLGIFPRFTALVNIEDSPTTPSRYGVRGIPTMMLFKDGQMASMKVGAMPKQKILEWLHETGVQAQDAEAL